MITLETLQRFCATDGREYLATPFTYGAFTYACGGVFCVHVPLLPETRQVNEADASTAGRQMLSVAKSCVAFFDNASIAIAASAFDLLPSFPREKQFEQEDGVWQFYNP